MSVVTRRKYVLRVVSRVLVVSQCDRNRRFVVLTMFGVSGLTYSIVRRALFT